MNTNMIKSLILVSVILLTSLSVFAETKGRIIPNGSFSVHKDGQVVANYSEQTVLDENALMACDGSCLVKLHGLSLAAVDQTKFAVKEVNGSISLYVEKGMVNFVVSDTSRQFAFYTPDGQYIKTEGFITTASTDKVVKGFYNVNDTVSEIGMQKGSMVVQTADGLQTVKPGQTIQLAMAEPPSDVPPVEKKDENKPAGFVPLWSSLSTPVQTVIVVGGIGAIVGAAVIVENNNKTTSNQASPNQ